MLANNVAQTFYSFYVSYFWDYGICPVPVADVPGAALEAISEHAPVCMKSVSFLAQADDGDPQPPDADTQSPNEVLMRRVVSSTFLYANTDGTSCKTIAGCYQYLLLVPPSDSENLMIGAPP